MQNLECVLFDDRTLHSDYNHKPLGDFAPCAPIHIYPLIPPQVLRWFFLNLVAPGIRHDNGVAREATYGLRKVEADLLRTYDRDHVVVADPDNVHRFMGDRTKVIGVYSMDPLGTGPLTTTYTRNVDDAMVKYVLEKTFSKIQKYRWKAPGAKFILGGPGALEFWQLSTEERIRQMDKLGLDYAVMGELDGLSGELFGALSNGHKTKNFMIDEDERMIFVTRSGSSPYVTNEMIPTIKGPSVHGLVEAMRGCGRNCDFCEPNLRAGRDIPIEKIVEEVSINARYGSNRSWIHAEDISLYKCEDKTMMYPNVDAISELFTAVMNVPGIEHSNATHMTAAPVAAEPKLLEALSPILRAAPDNWIGIQTGIEYGSARMIKNLGPNKVLPFKFYSSNSRFHINSDEDWQNLVITSLVDLARHHWQPAYTMIVGHPKATAEDELASLRLVARMHALENRADIPTPRYVAVPMAFVDYGKFKKLKDIRSYDLSKDLTPPAFAVIYATLLQNTRMAVNYLELQGTAIGLKNKIITTLGQLGFEYAVNRTYKWGQKAGMEPDKFMGIYQREYNLWADRTSDNGF